MFCILLQIKFTIYNIALPSTFKQTIKTIKLQKCEALMFYATSEVKFTFTYWTCWFRIKVLASELQ